MWHVLRHTLKAAVAVAALVGAVAWLSGGCGERIGSEDLAPEAHSGSGLGRVVDVVEEEAELFEQASGTISSAQHSTISSKILARIDDIPVRAGDVVEQGALVVRLDSRDLEARLRAAREDIAGARSDLALARSERERIASLYESNVASRQQLDRATATYEVATAKLEGAEQRAEDAEVALSHGEIRSPVNGRVIDRLAEPGDTAAPGAPLLRIYDPGTMRLEAPVREGLATRLTPGQKLRVRIEALDLTLEGEIDEIVPAAEPGARTFLVKVRLPDQTELYSGMFGRVWVPAGTGRRLVAPEEAFERIGQLEYATVVGSDGSPRRRLVTTGPEAGPAGVEVLSGLSAGERVVLP
jgi:membrane fusion protein (multidrug efflux system)